MIYVQPRIWKCHGIAEHAEYCFDDFLKFAEHAGCNLELGTFAYANALDGNWRSLVRGHQRALSTFKGEVSVHGVFQDICIHSNDSKIAKVSKQRILRNMDIAQIPQSQIRGFPRKLQPLRLRRTLQKQLDPKKRQISGGKSSTNMKPRCFWKTSGNPHPKS